MIRGLLNLLWRPDPDAPLEEDQVALNQLQNNDIPDRERPPDKEQVEHNQQQDENDTPDPKAPPNEEKEGSHQQQDQDDINDGDTRTNSTGPDVSRGIEDEDWMPRVAVRLSRQKTGLFQDQWRDRHAREECTYPLGMEDIWIPDSAITASSESSSNRGATRARLNKASGGGKSGSWCAKVDKEGQYLQIDLGRIATVKKIATQGRQDKAEWVTKYKVFYSKDGHKFLYQDKEYLGNTDQHTAVVNDLIQPIEARFVRICAMEWYGHISMRAELYGCYRPRETEEKIDEALKMGEFHFIKAEVNPKSLIDCKTNVLLKAFEVNKKLIELSEKGGPEQEEFKRLADAVAEFAITLIDPLKSDDDISNCYRSGLDYAVDRAIDLKQKKFIAHPVVDNLLQSKWYGSIPSNRNVRNATRTGRLTLSFLNLWAMIDMLVFPLLLALFYIIHRIRGGSLRKRKGTHICFVLALSEDAMTKEATSKYKIGRVFSLIRETICGVVRACDYSQYEPTQKYSVIQRGNYMEEIKFNKLFDDKDSLLEKINKIQMDETSPPLLHNDLDRALDAFHNHSNDSKKVLVVFVNDKVVTCGPNGETPSDLMEKLNELGRIGVQLVPIGIGQDVILNELRDLRVFIEPQIKPEIKPEINLKELPLDLAHIFGEYDPPDKLVKAIVKDVEGKDIYEHYLEYFTAPYIIFVRDTLTNLVLLGLLFSICLSPSYVAFSRLEWVIVVFFYGRAAVDQFPKMSGKERKKGKIRFYFSDFWNLLDFIILVTFIITLTLRMIIWKVSVSVADNRLLAVAEHFYGLVTMLFTLRTFGHAIEAGRRIGAIQIALFSIVLELLTIFFHFVAAILAFSLIITKVYVAERSYVSLRNATEELACSTAGFDCWSFVTKHLAWSVIGIAELEPLHSVDGYSLNLVHFLYSLFLIIGAILLLNMMIALLSTTYQRVEVNLLEEWSFKKARKIRSYCKCSPVPFPLNVLSSIAMYFWTIMRRPWPFQEEAIEIHRKVKALDKLVVELERIYMATHGYSFPLTDERKVDQLLYETKGNQQMTNQITRKVFEQQTSGQETGKNAWKSRGIEIEGCVLTCKAPYLCDVCRGIDSQRRHGARYNTPFTPKMPRLEVLIQESGESRILGIGAVYEKYNLHWQPGWRDGTVGYTADDGGIRESNRDGIPTTTLADEAMAYHGDLMACEVDFISEPTEPGTIPIKFFLNGREVATSKMVYTEGKTKLYPYIAMGCRGIRVLARMCPREKSDMVVKLEKTQLEIIQERLLQTIRKEMEEQRKIEKKERREMEEQRRKEMEELKSLLRQAIQMK